MLFDASLARLMSASSYPACSFLYTIPRSYLTSALTRLNSMQTAIKWWLDMYNDVFGVSRCHLVQSNRYIPHHALTDVQNIGDVVSRHNQVRNIFFETCRQGCVGGQKEVGSRLRHDERCTRPGDVLVPN